MAKSRSDNLSRLVLFGCLLLLTQSLSASDDFWLDSEDSVDSVSDGELRFLEIPPEKPVHHHFNSISINRRSLQNGWVMLRQCHFNLDPVHALEILYRREGIRQLRIISSNNIGSARVEGATVQLTDIEKGGQICIQAQSRALRRKGNGYLLKNGPYMRRFLDGYYPMQITLEVSFPETLKVRKVSPSKTAGLNVVITGASVKISGWFEGALYTQVWMCQKADKNCFK